jgi:hypothetical protein
VRAGGRIAELSVNVAEWLTADGACEVFSWNAALDVVVALVANQNLAARGSKVGINISEGRAWG